MAYVKQTGTESFPRWSVLTALVSVLAAFAVVLSGHGSLLLQRIEQGFSDLRTAFFTERLSRDHTDIVLVSVGDNLTPTRASFERRVDADRAALARLIDAIDDGAPRAIGFDVPLAGASDASKDGALQRALREAKARVIIGIRTGQPEVNPERRAWLNRFLRETGRASGHISVLYEGTRATAIDSPALTQAQPADSFAVLMARALRPEARPAQGPLTWLQKVENGGFFGRFFSIGGQQPFGVLYAADLLDSSKPLPTRQLAGRLVIVTTGLAEIERHPTPLTLWTGETVAPIQMQAQGIVQILETRSVIELQPRTLRMFLFALACLAGLIGWYRGVGGSLVGLLMAVVALLVVDAVAFSWQGLVLPIVPAVLVWVLGDTAGRSLRRVLRWEERHGHQWPLEGDDRTGRIARAG